MKDRRWITMTIATILIFTVLDLAFCWLTDPYGLFHNPVGRKLSIYFADRKAKFLMNERYVPANFDGLIIGPSSSSNWDASAIHGATVYNESELGANASEERRIAEPALRSGHFRLAICVLSPTMTNSHTMLDGLDTVTTREALGSIHVFVNEIASIFLRAHIRLGKDVAPYDGTKPMKPLHNSHPPLLAAAYFTMDPVALNDYRTLVRSLQSHGAAIVYVVPPLYEPCYQLNHSAFVDYQKKITTTMPPAPVIDFGSDLYTDLRSGRDSFVDCYHLSALGAARIDTLLSQLVNQTIASN